MIITSNIKPLNFLANKKDKNSSTEKNNKKEKKYVDPLTTWPARGLGYTNDIGIAINELSPSTARLFWVPALMYFGADIYDKYKNKGDKYKPNAQRAFNQAVFQAFASIILPAVFGHIGMSAFSQMDKYKGEKVSTNAKEQTLRYIKAHASINDALADGKNKEEALNEFVNDFNKFYRAKKVGYSHKNIIVKIYDKLLANCKRGAIANSNEERLKDYAKKQYMEILSTSSSTENAKHALDKKIFKQKAWKSAGAFTAILLTASLIDKFVEKIIIKKFVKPLQKQYNYRHYKMNDFTKSDNQTKTEAPEQKQ
jgi:hypothetical protein